MKGSIKIQEMIMELLPGMSFDERGIWRNHESSRKNEQPYWVATGFVHVGYRQWDQFFFNGRDTIKECAKRGITLHKEDNSPYYDVFAK